MKCLQEAEGEDDKGNRVAVISNDGVTMPKLTRPYT